jgi:hypothetical protein
MEQYRIGNIAIPNGQVEDISVKDNIDLELKKCDMRRSELANILASIDNENLRLQSELVKFRNDPAGIPHTPQDVNSHEITSEWIVNNPPIDYESTLRYYAKYRLSTTQPVQIQKFSKLVEALGYKKLRGKIIYWTRKQII